MNDYFTIDGFEQLSKQQMFDMAVTHLARTRQRSSLLSGACTYSGVGCAASVFLKPESRETADKVISVPAWHHLAERGFVPSNYVGFVSELQRCHDGADGERFVDSVRGRLFHLAEEHQLDDSKLALFDEVPT